MDDIRAVIKELRRIADAGERIAKAMEKQDKELTKSVPLRAESTEEETGNAFQEKPSQT